MYVDNDNGVYRNDVYSWSEAIETITEPGGQHAIYSIYIIHYQLSFIHVYFIIIIMSYAVRTWPEHQSTHCHVSQYGRVLRKHKQFVSVQVMVHNTYKMWI